MSNREIYEEIERQLQAGHPVVQATVVQTRGSVPRKEGSTMLVRKDGSLVGTVGGGCGEAGVIQKARLSLLDGKHREELADLTEDISLESEAVCGGTARVFIEAWQPGQDNLKLVDLLKNLSNGKEEVLVHQVVHGELEDDPRVGERIIVNAEGATLYPEPVTDLILPPAPERIPHQLKPIGGYEIYSERWNPIPRLVVVGAGHIAEPLESIARECGFDTVIVDDRSLFANRQRFPEASQVVCGPILDVVRQIDLSPHTYVVLVTRGHTLDMDALKVLIEREEPLAYIGMIGSKRRISAVYQLLEEQGYKRDLFENVYSPIGLQIASETPAEIAVSVLAEMIAVRRGADMRETLPLSHVSGLHPSLRRKQHA